MSMNDGHRVKLTILHEQKVQTHTPYHSTKGSLR